MRIAILGSGTRHTSLPAHLAAHASREIHLELVTPRLSLFAATPYERLATDLGYVDAAQQAAAAGCDAILINSFADYGIEAARCAVPMPVIGAGEAAMRAAAAGHDGEPRRYAIVTVWPASMRFLYDERLRACDPSQLCASLRHVSPESELQRLANDDGVMERMSRNEPAIIERIVAECERAVREDEVGAIALGCTCMGPVAAVVAAHCSVPVIESAGAGLRSAIAAVRAGAAGHVAGPRARHAQLIPEIVSSWAGAAAGASIQASQAPCPVCVD